MVSLGVFCFVSGSCCFCVGQSASLFVLVLASSSYLHLRVDLALADAVYQLVPEQEQEQQHQQAPTQFELEQDLGQAAEEPKAVEGKHRSMVPYFKLLCTYCYF